MTARKPRFVLTLLHRWLGLASALFLCVAGLTGAIISWDHELDGWLNPSFYVATTDGPRRPVLDLVRQFEATHPQARVTYMPLTLLAGEALSLSIEPRIDNQTGQAYALDYNQVALDPVTGQTQAQRQWGDTTMTRANLLPFLYKLHYSLHLPETGGLETGMLLMGLIAMVWVLDTLIALWLAFPNWANWRHSLTLRWRAGGHRLTFDLHRSGGVWIFLLVLMMAITSVAMNLNREVMRPLVSVVSTLSPSPFASRTPLDLTQAKEPRLSLPQVLAQAQQQAKERGWTQEPGGMSVSSRYGLFGVGFFPPGKGHGDGGLGNPWLYFDAQTGELCGVDIPGTGSAGDIWMQAMFPLHSGRILGTAGRVMISALGLAIAMLSITGVLVWARKRRARLHAKPVPVPNLSRTLDRHATPSIESI